MFIWIAATLPLFVLTTRHALRKASLRSAALLKIMSGLTAALKAWDRLLSQPTRQQIHRLRTPPPLQLGHPQPIQLLRRQCFRRMNPRVNHQHLRPGFPSSPTIQPHPRQLIAVWMHGSGVQTEASVSRMKRSTQELQGMTGDGASMSKISRRRAVALTVKFGQTQTVDETQESWLEERPFIAILRRFRLEPITLLRL